MEKLIRFEVDKLFGRFNYSIDMSLGEVPGLSIISAPNGYGKTTILKMMESFSSGDFLIFFREQYDSARFFLSSGCAIEIKKEEDELGDSYITLTDGVAFSKLESPITDSGFMLIVNIFEKYIPYLRRLGNKKWRDDKVGDVITLTQALSRYKSHPALKRIMRKKEAWIDDIISSLNVFTISTNRLSSLKKDGFDSSEQHLMVVNIAENIKSRINEAIRNQFEEGRKKETSFPTRIMDGLSRGLYPEKNSVLESIDKLTSIEEQYSRLGLIPNTETTRQFNSHVHDRLASGAGLLVLKTYLEDVLEKFSLLEDLARRLDVFCSSINKLLSFKEITTTLDEGFIVNLIDGKKNKLDLESLSSGEQHLIVLIGRLVFETTSECLVLIDEPEISFHPEWQEQFIKIISGIRSINGFDVVLATHSPVLIGGSYWDYVIELSEQYSPDEEIDVNKLHLGHIGIDRE